MKKVFGLLIAVLFSFSIVSCGSDDSKSSSTTTTGTATLTIVNNSIYVIDAVYYDLSSSTATTIYNKLPTGKTITVGSTYTISGIPAGVYDVSCDSNVSGFTWDSLNVTALQNGITFAAGKTITFTVKTGSFTVASTNVDSDADLNEESNTEVFGDVSVKAVAAENGSKLKK